MATPEPAYRFGYRGDIEGLRAVAIILVVIAHATTGVLDGGFVGVDVFFVLSGYLITGLLLREVKQSGKVDFLEFYSRRLRRLLPVLLLVVFCSCIAGTVLLAPFEQLDQVPSAIAATFWIGNMHFALSDLEYFGPAADENLFLHTWSLGVEEQFYLVWPALILAMLGTWSRFQGTLDYKQLRTGMLALLAISFLFSILLMALEPALAFYAMPSRAWQFALGALVLVGTTNHAGGLRVPNYTIRAIGWAGLGAILLAAMLLDSRTAYPGYWALLPSFGAAAILVSGAGLQDAGVGRALSIAPLRGIGRVSYGWYLWHWPVLLLGGTFADRGNPYHVMALVLLSFCLAVASYCLLEAPIRSAAALRGRPRPVLLGSAMLTLGLFVAIGGWRLQAIEWNKRPEQLRIARARVDAPVIYNLGCDEWFRSARARACVFGASDAPRTVVVIGDSVGLQWFPAIARSFTMPEWRIVVLTKSACPIVDVPKFYARIGRVYTECATWREQALVFIEQTKPDAIVIGSGIEPFSREEWTEGSGRIFARLAHASPNINVILPTPRLGRDGPGCLAREAWRGRYLPFDSDCSTVVHGVAEIAGWITEAAARHPEVHIIDPTGLVCPDNRCRGSLGGLIVFRDGQHLTATFVESLSGRLADLLAASRTAPAAAPTAAGTSIAVP